MIALHGHKMSLTFCTKECCLKIRIICKKVRKDPFVKCGTLMKYKTITLTCTSSCFAVDNFFVGFRCSSSLVDKDSKRGNRVVCFTQLPPIASRDKNNSHISRFCSVHPCDDRISKGLLWWSLTEFRFAPNESRIFAELTSFFYVMHMNQCCMYMYVCMYVVCTYAYI